MDKSSNSLEKAEERIKVLEKTLYNSLEKELPSLTKKQIKFKLLGKLKTKYQQFKQFVKKKTTKSSRARVGLPGRN